MKCIFPVFLLFIYCLKVSASPPGKNRFSAGYGFGIYSGNFLFAANYSGSYRQSFTGPFYVKYSYRFYPKVSFGINAFFHEEQLEFNYASGSSAIHEEEKQREYAFLLRGDYTFFSDDHAEIFIGTAIGFKHQSRTIKDEVRKTSVYTSVQSPFPFAFEATIGGRYFFTNHLSVYAEAGAARSIIQAGCGFSF
jgi:hypothetical protein